MRILLLSLLCSAWLPAQHFVFSPIHQGELVQLDNSTSLSEVTDYPDINSTAGQFGAAAGARVRIEALRWYLSGFALLQQGEVVYTQKDSHHLLDVAEPASLTVSLAAPEDMIYDAVRFTLGVDSLTAAGGAFGGDLDPTKGMYWTWRSGYINFKLEGTSPDCPGRKHRFQYHIGGYQAPFNSIREVTLPVTQADNHRIIIDLDAFFRRVDVATQYQIMSPNAAAMGCADLLATIFKSVRPE